METNHVFFGSNSAQPIEALFAGLDITIIKSTFDSDFNVIFADEGLFAILGYTREEFAVLGSCLGSLIPPTSMAAFKGNVDSSTLSNPFVSICTDVLAKSGTVKSILIKGIISLNSANFLDFHGIVIDITSQQKREQALILDIKRCEIAIKLSALTMFEYDIVTRDLILYNDVASAYNMPSIIPNGPEAMVQSGSIAPASCDAYLEMYNKIHLGQAFAQCFVHTKDKNGDIHPYELSLTTIFDTGGKPLRAIGVRKDVGEIRQLKREEKFGQTLVSDKKFVCEADITNDLVVRLDPQWMISAGVKSTQSFSTLITEICQNIIAPEFHTLLKSKLSKDYITSLYKNGDTLFTFQYKKLSLSDEYLWFEATINIIQDSITKDISIRYYISNVDAKKKKEQKALEEQMLYETMLAKAIMAYEVNITQNKALSGHEKWGGLYNLKVSDDYSVMIEKFAKKIIHSEDGERFLQIFARENLISLYKSGYRVQECQYKKLGSGGEYTWVSCTLHMYEDPETGDIKGYSYVEDIDSQKKSELALKYNAEHDALTGFYNKATTEQKISQFLSENVGSSQNHALIMIDLDFFKEINDNFGHVFGDAVLAQAASKILALFRTADICGRIGGDEFIVLMQNICDKKVVHAKVSELCSELSLGYYKGSVEHRLSASVGVAFSQEDGSSYEELYRHADSAMYVSKNNGRNCYSLYSSDMEIIDVDAKAIRPSPLLEIKSFEENISEYIFRILFEAKDKEEGLQSVLGLIGKHLNISRVYVFETTDNGVDALKTHEWWDPDKGCLLQNRMSFAQLGSYKNYFNSDGISYINPVDTFENAMRKTYDHEDIRSILHIAVIRDDNLAGFVGFERDRGKAEFTKREISIAHSLSQILGVFILEMRAAKKSKDMENMAMSVVNGIDSYAYVCDPETFDMLFANQIIVDTLIAAGGSGDYRNLKCYQLFMGKNEPCSHCPIKLLGSGASKGRVEIKHEKTDIWLRVCASWIKWGGDKTACLLDCVDITDYKKLMS